MKKHLLPKRQRQLSPHKHPLYLHRLSPTTPKISIHPKDGKQVSSFSLASIRKKKEWEQQQKPAKTEAELPSDPFTQEQVEQYWKNWQEQKTKKRTEFSLAFSAKST